MNNWSYNEFLGFVLIYAANSDQRVLPEEIEMIENKVGHSITEHARSLIKDMNDIEIVDMILTYKDRYFPDEASRETLYRDMEAVYKADGTFSSEEKMALMMIKKIIQ